MRKSRIEAAETRERIVATASKMFLNQGLGSVGVRDIMAAADLTPGGFYRHFESKEHLVAEANATAFDGLLARLESAAVGKSPTKAVMTIVSLYLGQSRGKDKSYLCPLSMLGAELSHGDQEVRAVAMSGYQRLVQLIADSFMHRTRPEAHTLASSIVSTMVGAVTLAGIMPDPATASGILHNAEALIKERLSAA